jgi:hypothetical protein
LEPGGEGEGEEGGEVNAVARSASMELGDERLDGNGAGAGVGFGVRVVA